MNEENKSQTGERGDQNLYKHFQRENSATELLLLLQVILIFRILAHVEELFFQDSNLTALVGLVFADL